MRGERIRLAILGSRGIPAEYGGFETFAEELALRLVDRGLEVTVYCEATNGTSSSEYGGVCLKYIPSVRLGPLTTILYDIRCIWHARKTNDVVYMLGYGAAIFCMIPRFWGSKVWINPDGVEWWRAKWNGLAKLYFKLMEIVALWVSNMIIADAKAIKTHFHARHRCLPPFSVIPYGADVIDVAPDECLLREWGLKSRAYYLVVARLDPENHIIEIIEGCRNAKSSIPLVVVGSYEAGTRYVKELLGAAGEDIRFIGGVYDKWKLQALRFHSRVYFHGHSVGGTNPSLLEALGCGNLVIAHDNQFNREVAGNIGFYFSNECDIPVLLAEIEALSDEARMEFAARARAKIKDGYCWDRIVDTYASLLREVC